jgi:hypothetical protein
MCSLTIEGVLLLQNVFPYYRTCCLTENVLSYYRRCSHTIEGVLLLHIPRVSRWKQKVFSYYRRCSLTTHTKSLAVETGTRDAAAGVEDEVEVSRYSRQKFHTRNR